MSQDPNQFPDKPEEFLPLEGLVFETIVPRFDPNQRRAFGSVPGLLGKELDVPPFHRLNEQAWTRTEPSVLERGLFGQEGNNAVNGLVLSPEQYGAIIRNQKSFQASIRAKTIAASRNNNDIRAQEKELRSVAGALHSKQDRHEKVLKGLESEREVLDQLQEWQQTPGYSRTSEVEMRAKASQAWHGSFYNILSVLKDQHDLSSNELVDMEQALAYRLTRGPQVERVDQWGKMLGVSLKYNRAVSLLFTHSDRLITSERERLELDLGHFYYQHGIQPASK